MPSVAAHRTFVFINSNAALVINSNAALVLGYMRKPGCLTGCSCVQLLVSSAVVQKSMFAYMAVITCVGITELRDRLEAPSIECTV